MRETGRLGEQVAADYLRRRGYQIVQTNAFTRTGEIDIVAKKEGILHLCEVKTRAVSGPRGSRPAEALTPQKRRRLRASAVCLSHRLPAARAYCCDLISVEVHTPSGEVSVEHMHDEF